MPQLTPVLGETSNTVQVIALDSRKPEQVLSDKQYLKVLQLSDLLSRYLDVKEILEAFSNEIKGLVAGLRTVGDELKDRGIVSAFAFAASDDDQLGTAFVAAGYRKTGLLAQGVKIGDERKDAILWSRKLANPAEDE